MYQVLITTITGSGVASVIAVFDSTVAAETAITRANEIKYSGVFVLATRLYNV